MVFQNYAIFPSMTVEKNVLFGLENRHVPKAEAQERTMEMLAKVKMEHLAKRFPENLSGGQQKLLELARVLMAEPKLILLDEPGAGVNPTLLATIMDKLQELHARGITFLIIEHNMDLITQLCNPVLVLAQGRLLMQGTPQAVRSDPRVLEAYLGGETP